MSEKTPLSSHEQKSVLELRKLAAEVRSAERPWWKNAPTSATILISAFAVGVQYCSSDRAYDLAKIERAQAQYDIARLAIERQKAESVLAQSLATATAVNGLRAAEERRLASARRAVSLAESTLFSLPASTRSSTAAASQALASAASGLRDASGAQAREIRGYERRIAQLQSDLAKVARLDTVPSWILIGKRQRGSARFDDPPFGLSIPRIGTNLCVSAEMEFHISKFDRLPALSDISLLPPVTRRGVYQVYSILRVLEVDSVVFPRRPNDDAESWSSWVFARVTEVGNGNIEASCAPTRSPPRY